MQLWVALGVLSTMEYENQKEKEMNESPHLRKELFIEFCQEQSIP